MRKWKQIAKDRVAEIDVWVREHDGDVDLGVLGSECDDALVFACRAAGVRVVTSWMDLGMDTLDSACSLLGLPAPNYIKSLVDREA